MKWTIYQLHQMAKKSFEFDETVELNELTKLNSDIRSISPVRVKAARRLNPSKFRLTLRFQAKWFCRAQEL